ncbi:Peroxidase 52, partial [Ananas comosus]
GCDGSNLLDDTPFFTGEKNAAPNKNSARGFEVVDRIKDAVNYACGGNVVSCADILAVAARDSVAALGGPSYQVQLGRRDSTTASAAAANSSIPAPTFDFDRLLANFNSHGLSLVDLVALAGGHTLGFARCINFRDRLYNETATLDSGLASYLKSQCPLSGGDDNLAPLDDTPVRFDTSYFDRLLRRKGLLHSDQQLFKGDWGGADGLVSFYSSNPEAFAKDFGESMIRMGALSPLTGSAGEIRLNCRRSFTLFALIPAIFFPAFAQLTSDFYDSICPQALSTIQATVEAAIIQEPRMGASLVRLHFHDCFVNGCDGSILLDDTPAMTGEKTAKPNKNSARGFDVVDQIKSAVNDACLGNVVSCADILAVAARDSIVALGGASYDVLLGRRDATDASLAAANANIPAPTLDLAGLVSNFQSQGLSLSDLVVLSGAHTLGFARCVSFRNRIYNETADINSDFAASLQAQCPPDAGDGDDVLASLDDTPFVVDTDYYQGLLQNQGLLHSDQQLFQGDGSDSDNLVQFYSQSPTDFWSDFGTAMINMEI